LILEGEVVGVLQVMADATGAYGPADLELLEGISLLLAVALENARLFRRLEDELEERRRTERHLRATEAALLHADRRKDEFLATLGHELRNPLNPIRSAVELLQLRAPADPETRRAHEVIRRQVLHLSRLMDDLLDVSRITRGKLDLQRVSVSLGDVLQSALESIRPLVEGLGQDLVVDGETALRVDADPVRLAQVFSNLFDNASKYAPPGSRIAVQVEHTGDRVVDRHHDAGRGIAPEHLPHVFDLFYQAGTSAEGGLGIGLTLVKQLVELHGGTIDAESDGVGRGSTFRVRLPLATATAVPPPRPAPERPERTWRLLVADDNRDSAESMAMLLATLGHE
ncbi:MAG TPA: ATP-binding protein, partial [Planctomycetota bacterium]|nr:ATP-binding protein [Planctomycetota bacterium]